MKQTIYIAIGLALATLLLAAQTAEAAITYPVNGGTGSSTLSGVLKGNGTSPVQTAVNGSDYTLITGMSCSAGYHISGITSAGVITCTADTGGSGATSLATTSPWTTLQLVQVAGNGTVNSIATSSLRLTTSAFNSPNVSQWTNDAGYLTSNQNITLSGDITGSGSTAITTTYSNVVPANKGGAGTINGLLKANGSGVVSAAAAGTDYENPLTFSFPLSRSANAISFIGLSTTSPWTNGQLAYVSGNNLLTSVATSSVSSGTGISLSGTGAVVGSGLTITNTSPLSGLTTSFPLSFSNPTLSWIGLATSSNIAAPQVLYATGANTFAGVATSTATCSTASGISCTSFSFLGAGGSTLSLSAIPNTSLANSTISGVSLGSSLFSHTHNSTLNGTSYNGSAAVSDWGLNLGNANTWTALQQFGNASTSLLSSYGPSYFGATATSSFSTAGVLSLVNGSAGTPSLNLGDAATGLFRSALNAIGFAINGVEKMTLNATGLGVGSTSPSTLLSVGTPTTPGTILSAEYQPATSTSMTIDFKNGNQQLVRMGTAATTIAFTNALPGTSLRLIVCNPNASAGALTFSGVDWTGGTAPTQTTTANQCDVWSFLVSGATSTAKVFGAQTSGFQ